MADLNISNTFDWSMLKTLDVVVTLPEDDDTRLLHIYSQDGKKLYFEGHPEDKAEPVKAFIWAHVAQRNGYNDAESVLSFSRMQITDTVQKKALELVSACIESNYTRCPK